MTTLLRECVSKTNLLAHQNVLTVQLGNIYMETIEYAYPQRQMTQSR